MKLVSPQSIFQDFKKNVYFDQNNKLLIPVYSELFKNISKGLNKTDELNEKINDLKDYSKHIYEIISSNNIELSKEANELPTDKIRKLIKDKKLKKAVISLNFIVKFLSKNRTNINGLEILSWSLFKETSLGEITTNFSNNPKGCIDALVSNEFLGLMLVSKNFIEIAINDLLIDIEFIDPNRRKGMFDALVFKSIANELKVLNTNFIYNPNDKKIVLDQKNNWISDEKNSKKLKLTLPKSTKLIDVLCKINDTLIVGSHKEQKAKGGAQDNQANDAKSILSYSNSDIKKFKKIFNVKTVIFCIILQAKFERIKSNHWTPIFRIVNQKNNNNKYLLNGFQFGKLLKYILQN